jgi:hypothetical protein
MLPAEVLPTIHKYLQGYSGSNNLRNVEAHVDLPAPNPVGDEILSSIIFLCIDLA